MTMPAVTKIREDQTAPKKERMLIGGEWVDSALGEWLEVEDPAHRRPIAEVPRNKFGEQLSPIITKPTQY